MGGSGSGKAGTIGEAFTIAAASSCAMATLGFLGQGADGKNLSK